MSGDGLNLKLEDLLKSSGETTSSTYVWDSLQDEFQDTAQALSTVDAFGRDGGGGGAVSPEPPCSLTKEEAQELMMSDVLRPALEQLPQYMQDGQSMIDSYDDATFFEPFDVQEQQDVFCSQPRQIGDGQLPRLPLPAILPQVSQNSGASAETAGPGGLGAIYGGSWARAPDHQQHCTAQQPRLMQTVPVMAYPMPHAGFPGGYQALRAVGPEYPTVVAYYSGAPGWQYQEILCNGWVPSAPVPVLDQMVDVPQPIAMLKSPPQVMMHPQSMQACSMAPHMQGTVQMMMAPPGVATAYYQQPIALEAGHVQPELATGPSLGARPSAYACQSSCVSSEGSLVGSGMSSLTPMVMGERLHEAAQPQGQPAAKPGGDLVLPVQRTAHAVHTACAEGEWKVRSAAQDDVAGNGREFAVKRAASPPPLPVKVKQAVMSPRKKEEEDAGCSPRREVAGAPGPPNSRLECLERYREKKRKRTNQPTVRYYMRKINADNRPRIKGRFVKANATPDMRNIFPTL